MLLNGFAFWRLCIYRNCNQIKNFFLHVMNLVSDLSSIRCFKIIRAISGKNIDDFSNQISFLFKLYQHA